MGKCETENLSDSAYFQVATGIKKKSTPELQRVYDTLNRQQNQPDKPKTSWLRFLLFWK